MPVNRRLKYSFAAGLLLVVLLATWFLLRPKEIPLPDMHVEASEVSSSGILDGMTFAGSMDPVGEMSAVDDTFVFENGSFASTECDKRCGYPARPYYVRHVGDEIEFVTQSHCLYKDARIAWRGTIKDGTLRGVSTWTVNRWYWTIEKDYVFEGTLVESTGPVASNQ